MDTPLRHFLEIPYEQLEEMNVQAKGDRVAGTICCWRSESGSTTV